MGKIKFVLFAIASSCSLHAMTEETKEGQRVSSLKDLTPERQQEIEKYKQECQAVVDTLARKATLERLGKISYQLVDKTSLRELLTKSNLVSINDIEVLLQNGADVNEACNSSGIDLPPLSLAAYKGRADICDFLLKRGADINAKSKNGATALHYALSLNHIEVCKVLVNSSYINLNIKNGNNFPPIILATAHHHVEIARLLLMAGADIRITDSYTRTGLMAAVIYLEAEIAKFMIHLSLFIPQVSFASVKNICSILKYLKEANMSSSDLCLLALPPEVRKEIVTHYIRLNIAPLLYNETIIQLKKLMKKALHYAPREELKKLVDPSTLEEQHGHEIKKTIEWRLKTKPLDGLLELLGKMGDHNTIVHQLMYKINCQ